MHTKKIKLKIRLLYKKVVAGEKRVLPHIIRATLKAL